MACHPHFVPLLSCARIHHVSMTILDVSGLSWFSWSETLWYRFIFHSMNRHFAIWGFLKRAFWKKESMCLSQKVSLTKGLCSSSFSNSNNINWQRRQHQPSSANDESNTSQRVSRAFCTKSCLKHSLKQRQWCPSESHQRKSMAACSATVSSVQDKQCLGTDHFYLASRFLTRQLTVWTLGNCAWHGHLMGEDVPMAFWLLPSAVFDVDVVDLIVVVISQTAEIFARHFWLCCAEMCSFHLVTIAPNSQT